MDQANTLRSMLGQAQYVVEPVLAESDSPYIRPLCQAVLNLHAAQKNGAIIFDSGILMPDASARSELLGVLQNRDSLEDVAKALLPNQFLVPSKQGFKAMFENPALLTQLMQKMHRLPATCDHLYATLSFAEWQLAMRLSPATDWCWLVQPTAGSVTQVFKAIRQLGYKTEGVHHRIIVTGVDSAAQADDVYATLQDTVAAFSSNPLQYCGHVPKLHKGVVGADFKQACKRVAKVLAASGQLACA